MKHTVDPAVLKAAAVIESGGEMIWNQQGSGAYGIMQIKERIWGAKARALGYDVTTPEGNIGRAAAMLGGDVSGVKGSTPEERFLSTSYPVLNPDGSVCDDCRSEHEHTPGQYLSDMQRLIRIIDGETSPAPLDPWRPYPYPPMVNVHVK